MASQAAFWDGIAEKYAARPIQNLPAYEATLERVRARLAPQDRVLELGCGTGSTALNLAGQVAHVTATDVSPGMIAIARRKAAEAGCDNIRFETAAADMDSAATFDAVMAFNLLHLVPDLRASLAAMARQVRPGGLMITKTPCLAARAWLFRPMIWVMQRFGKAPGVSYLSPGGLERAVTEAGFEILETGDYPARQPPNHFIVARKL